jgi:peptidoglycan/xylan/chitin deacetylase (PgdA/CDA1 family)
MTFPTHTDDGQPIVYLTFDDGPSPYTPLLLDVLAQYNAQAFFFVIGQSVEASPDIVKATLEAGHHVGNHTYTHPNLAGIDYETFFKEVDSTQTAIMKAVPEWIAAQGGLRYLRPPYFGMDENTADYAAKLGYELVLGEGGANDWDEPGVEHIVSTVMPQVKPGLVIVLHDGGGDRSQTVEAVRQLLAHFTEQGYVFRSIQQV